MNFISRLRLISFLLLLGCLPFLAAADDSVVLFQNVRIFNGVDAELQAGHVLVRGDTIVQISKKPIAPPKGATVIDGGGRVLSPGFIDIHAHLTFSAPKEWEYAHPFVIGAVAGNAAQDYLDRGFTTIRDAGGTPPQLAKAIEAGLLVGPRVYPSGAIVSQTSGHGDSRRPEAPHALLGMDRSSRLLGSGLSILADGTTQTLIAVRENLRAGATQIKIMGGGGVASDFDPIHTLQPSPDEIRAAVQAASDWGTYVMAHAYTAEAIRRLVENGVKVIEHGLLIDDETAQLCADKDIVISTQISIFSESKTIPGIEGENLVKLRQVQAGQKNLIRLIKKHGIKMGFGTDYIYGTHTEIGEEFVARTQYFSAAEIMRQVTSESAEIIRMCGKLNRHGNFGEIREGWKADIVLIDGEPLEDITPLRHPQKVLPVIMRAGHLHRNDLANH